MDIQRFKKNITISLSYVTGTFIYDFIFNEVDLKKYLFFLVFFLIINHFLIKKNMSIF